VNENLSRFEVLPAPGPMMTGTQEPSFTGGVGGLSIMRSLEASKFKLDLFGEPQDGLDSTIKRSPVNRLLGISLEASCIIEED
jgi:hypothetical protein